jgi:hypothetical protein
MIELSRRSFLKSIATLVAYTAVPVEITKTIDYLVSQPELPITKSNPSGWMKIDGSLFPIVSNGCIQRYGHGLPDL